MSLPIQWNEWEDFQEFILNALSKFSKVIISEFPEKEEKIVNLIDILEKIFKLFLHGKPHEAFSLFKSSSEINESDKELTILQDLLKNPKGSLYIKEEHRFFYRARNEGKLSKIKKKDDMFHIPFDKRAMVGSERYSIPGFPCLYVGASALVCWEEMGRPPLDDFYISMLRYKGDYSKILDFSWTPKMIFEFLEGCQFWYVLKKDLVTGELTNDEIDKKNKSNLEKITEWLDNFLNTWPILMMCSIKQKDPDAKFKIEFVIPQFILQYLIYSRVYSGIRYFSMNCNEDFIFPGYELKSSRKYINYIFPPRNIEKVGHCSELKKLFPITFPTSFQILTAINYKPPSYVLDKWNIQIPNDEIVKISEFNNGFALLEIYCQHQFIETLIKQFCTLFDVNPNNLRNMNFIFSSFFTTADNPYSPLSKNIKEMFNQINHNNNLHLETDKVNFEDNIAKIIKDWVEN